MSSVNSKHWSEACLSLSGYWLEHLFLAIRARNHRVSVYAQDLRQAKQYNYFYLGGSLVAIREQPTGGTAVALYQHTDALGSPVAVTDAARTIVEKSQYEPYGGLLNRPLEDGPGYTGHVSDAATGLSYMQQRYYDPKIGGGRFLSVDPVTATSVGGNFNRYWYANNNPYKYTDPDGREVACNGKTCTIQCDLVRNCAGDFAKYGAIRTLNDFLTIQSLLLRPFVQANESAESGDADPNGPTTKETKTRGSKGADGGESAITKETDATGRTISTTHTVTTDGEVVHQHQDHIGEAGSKRRFSDESTGTTTVGEGDQAPPVEDRDPNFPPEPVKEPSRY